MGVGVFPFGGGRFDPGFEVAEPLQQAVALRRELPGPPGVAAGFGFQAADAPGQLGVLHPHRGLEGRNPSLDFDGLPLGVLVLGLGPAEGALGLGFPPGGAIDLVGGEQAVPPPSGPRGRRVPQSFEEMFDLSESVAFGGQAMTGRQRGQGPQRFPDRILGLPPGGAGRFQTVPGFAQPGGGGRRLGLGRPHRVAGRLGLQFGVERGSTAVQVLPAAVHGVQTIGDGLQGQIQLGQPGQPVPLPSHRPEQLGGPRRPPARGGPDAERPVGPDDHLSGDAGSGQSRRGDRDGSEYGGHHRWQHWRLRIRRFRRAGRCEQRSQCRPFGRAQHGQRDVGPIRPEVNAAVRAYPGVDQPGRGQSRFDAVDLGLGGSVGHVDQPPQSGAGPAGPVGAPRRGVGVDHPLPLPSAALGECALPFVQSLPPFAGQLLAGHRFVRASQGDDLGHGRRHRRRILRRAGQGGRQPVGSELPTGRSPGVHRPGVLRPGPGEVPDGVIVLTRSGLDHRFVLGELVVQVLPAGHGPVVGVEGLPDLSHPITLGAHPGMQQPLGFLRIGDALRLSHHRSCAGGLGGVPQVPSRLLTVGLGRLAPLLRGPQLVDRDHVFTGPPLSVRRCSAGLFP